VGADRYGPARFGVVLSNVLLLVDSAASQLVKLFDDHQLIQSGPYAYVRHPMYFGWWVAMFGLTLLYPV
jgi:protein-S-isoprenylcysteine O-methyltransferase Ste14